MRKREQQLAHIMSASAPEAAAATSSHATAIEREYATHGPEVSTSGSRPASAATDAGAVDSAATATPGLTSHMTRRGSMARRRSVVTAFRLIPRAANAFGGAVADHAGGGAPAASPAGGGAEHERSQGSTHALANAALDFGGEGDAAYQGESTPSATARCEAPVGPDEVGPDEAQPVTPESTAAATLALPASAGAASEVVMSTISTDASAPPAANDAAAAMPSRGPPASASPRSPLATTMPLSPTAGSGVAAARTPRARARQPLPRDLTAEEKALTTYLRRKPQLVLASCGRAAQETRQLIDALALPCFDPYQEANHAVGQIAAERAAAEHPHADTEHAYTEHADTEQAATEQAAAEQAAAEQAMHTHAPDAAAEAGAPTMAPVPTSGDATSDATGAASAAPSAADGQLPSAPKAPAAALPGGGSAPGAAEDELEALEEVACQRTLRRLKAHLDESARTHGLIIVVPRGPREAPPSRFEARLAEGIQQMLWKQTYTGVRRVPSIGFRAAPAAGEVVEALRLAWQQWESAGPISPRTQQVGCCIPARHYALFDCFSSLRHAMTSWPPAAADAYHATSPVARHVPRVPGTPSTPTMAPLHQVRPISAPPAIPQTTGQQPTRQPQHACHDAMSTPRACGSWDAAASQDGRQGSVGYAKDVHGLPSLRVADDDGDGSVGGPTDSEGEGEPRLAEGAETAVAAAAAATAAARCAGALSPCASFAPGRGAMLSTWGPSYSPRPPSRHTSSPCTSALLSTAGSTFGVAPPARPPSAHLLDSADQRMAGTAWARAGTVRAAWGLGAVGVHLPSAMLRGAQSLPAPASKRPSSACAGCAETRQRDHGLSPALAPHLGRDAPANYVSTEAAAWGQGFAGGSAARSTLLGSPVRSPQLSRARVFGPRARWAS